MVQTRKQDSGVRGQVIDAALELFSTKGFAATPVREIVEKAGVTKPALYYHFGSKEGLLKAMVDEGFTEYEARIHEMTAQARNAREAMVKLVQTCFELTMENPKLAGFMYLVFFGSESDSAGVNTATIARRYRNLAAGVIELAVNEGLLERKHAERGELLLSGLMNIHVMAYLKGELPELNTAVAVEAVDLYLRGVSASGGDKANDDDREG